MTKQTFQPREYATPGFLSLEESNSESEGTALVIPTQEETDVCEKNYKRMAEESRLKDSNLLLLDEVLIPLEETEVDPFSKTIQYTILGINNKLVLPGKREIML